MPPTSLVIQAYKRNDEWHKDASNPDFYNPEYHERTKKLIKKVEGQWWKVTIDDKEDWQLAFLDYWESSESGKDRRSPQQVAADKVEASKKALPPSMQGDVVVPTQFKLYKTMKEARDSKFTNADIHFMYLRFSSDYSGGLDVAKLSGANQLADFQKVSGEAFPVAFMSISGWSFARPEAPPYLVTAIDRLSAWKSTIHFFVLGLEGFFGERSALQNIYDAIKKNSLDLANKATITYALQDTEADLYENQAEFLRISDTKVERRCIRVYLHGILLATTNKRIDWLREQFKLRTTGRTSLEGAINAADFYKKRVAASLNVKRHRAYGNLKGNDADEDMLE